MKQEVIAVFDIGKTNKKVLLFDKDLKLVFQNEGKFDEIIDDDGFPCDDIERIENWILDEVQSLANSAEFELKAVNFAPYGATLVYLNKDGKRLTPAYNYLKPMPDNVLTGFYEKYGGVDEFSRKTASPALGMLNSGLQALWLKTCKPDIYKEVSAILHFPQYLSYLVSKNITSEFTSIGCHTAMWNFDQNCYHQWLSDANIELPQPVANNESVDVKINNKTIKVGIGIHDSSSSLVPYLLGSSGPFILISTGTWCIFMNPFNDEPLTSNQLKSDALCYMSTRQKQVKSSRLFMGYIHDVNNQKLTNHFNIPSDAYKQVKVNEKIISENIHNRVFFKNGISTDYIDNSVDLSMFINYDEAYHQLVIDLVHLAEKSLKLIVNINDSTKSVFVTGGFAKNEIFVKLLATIIPDKSIFTSEINNATAFGAAMILYEKVFTQTNLEINLGLKKIEAFELS